MITGWLWIVFTVIAAFFQTVRNAMQRELTTSSAPSARRMCGSCSAFRSRCCLLIGVLLVTGVPLPRPGLRFWPWVIDGALRRLPPRR